MILIGQYDSPFVRRVAIAMSFYGITFEHRPWSVFRDTAKLAPFNPLTRVPTLVLDSGETVIESAYILDYLDELAGAENALIPAAGAARREALKVCALACGLGDKAVSLVYERLLHKEKSEVWMSRCATQMDAVLDALETDRAQRDRAFWFGDKIGHADIAVACALQFAREAHPSVFTAPRWPALIAYGDKCEELSQFKSFAQAFCPPPENS